MNYALTPITSNKKLGFMATSISHKDTCPDTCSFKKGGCYGLGGPMNLHWTRATEGKYGHDWDTFLENVRSLPRGFTFRHNQVGDLPEGETNLDIDIPKMVQLIKATSHLKAYTYTHKPVLQSKAEAHNVSQSTIEANRFIVKKSNEEGFTVNISCDGLHEVDEAVALNIGPVTTVLPLGAPHKQVTEGGNKVIVCPAQTIEHMTCAKCMLCDKQRSVVVGFLAHGNSKNKVSKIVDSK
jgi:hypothetical protein